MLLVKQELYGKQVLKQVIAMIFTLHIAAVYSNDCTSHPVSVHRQHQHSSLSKSPVSTVTPLPYFVLAQRLGEKKAGEHNKLKLQISSLKEQ